MDINFFYKKPFEHPLTKKFLTLAKNPSYQNLLAFTDMIKENRYLVYEFDETSKTALHWACKRNNCDILEILISNGAELDK